MKSKVIPVFLTLALTASLLVSCGAKDEKSTASFVSQPENESNASLVETSTPQTESEEAPDAFDYGGAEVTIFTTWSSTDYMSEITPNDLTAGSTEYMTEAVNDAIAERNRRVENLLNVKIKEYHTTASRMNSEALQEIRNAYYAGTSDYCIVTPSLYDLGTLAAEGALYDLNSFENLNTASHWWDQSFNQTLTINNHLYFTIGDIGLVSKNATPVVYFNKQMAADLGLESLYQTVKDGKWTFDEAYRLAKMVSTDVNEDDVIDYRDIVGWAGQNDDTWNFFYGANEKLVTAYADGSMKLTMYNTRSTGVMEKMLQLFQDSDHYISANNYFNASSTPTIELTGQAFIDGRVLFFSDNLSFIYRFQEMEDDFGMLPVPKYNEEQDNYCSLINPWTGNAFAIPKSVSEEEAEMAAAVLEAMGYYSSMTVMPEYMERTLKYQKTRDEESETMLDLIFSTCGCDIGTIYNIGSQGGTNTATGLPWLLHAMLTADAGTFSSKYQSCEGAAQADLDALIAQYQ